ncbi:MAG: polysaccharide deacetylase family protein [candidate division Zixibacteria bacterium]|nr:polysaccharide deacetylase family protein [candidate division Zixibacteria bacterium]
MKKLYTTGLFSILLFLLIFCIGFSQEEKSDTTKSSIKSIITKKPLSKKIAITFDNLPGEQIYSIKERSDINSAILSALKKRNVPATGFVVGEYVEGEDWESIVSWLENDQTLGYHTYTGQEILGMPMGLFISDIIKGKEAIEDLVSTYKQSIRFFRFPYLHYASNAKAKLTIVEQLVKMNTRIAHVSITAEDFVYNMSLEKILKSGDSLDLHYLRQEYLNHLTERLAHFEDLAKEVVGRPIRHIIQFRTNRINSLLLDDIITEIADKGYQFITLRDALKDKVYRKSEEYYGDKGFSFLERLKYSQSE